MTKSKCFCGGDGCYIDHNCGASFKRSCPHCNGTGNKACNCQAVTVDCGGRYGHEIDERPDRRTKEQIEDDDAHWMFMD